ncbi:hypothetical protein K439DRAFT_1641887 [Ramaria rubella]|nr:hypothetical protein K439DRAFT_1641887 [Ramaria rubella]
MSPAPVMQKAFTWDDGMPPDSTTRIKDAEEVTQHSIPERGQAPQTMAPAMEEASDHSMPQDCLMEDTQELFGHPAPALDEVPRVIRPNTAVTAPLRRATRQEEESVSEFHSTWPVPNSAPPVHNLMPASKRLPQIYQEIKTTLQEGEIEFL